MAISRETVEYVAHLARIKLVPDELEKLTGQLEQIVSFIDKLNKLDTKDVPPTSHILPITNILRQDSPSGSLSPEEALKNAPSSEGNFFVVPKVIE